jgi:hypothetical protein
MLDKTIAGFKRCEPHWPQRKERKDRKGARRWRRAAMIAVILHMRDFTAFKVGRKSRFIRCENVCMQMHALATVSYQQFGSLLKNCANPFCGGAGALALLLVSQRSHGYLPSSRRVIAPAAPANWTAGFLSKDSQGSWLRESKSCSGRLRTLLPVRVVGRRSQTAAGMLRWIPNPATN